MDNQKCRPNPMQSFKLGNPVLQDHDSRALRAVLALLFFAVVAGCSQVVPDPLEKPHMFSNAPGIAYLWSLGSLHDMKPPSGFRSWIIGRDVLSENQVAKKPYGIAVTKGKIYINDGRWLSGYWVLDLAKEDFYLIQDRAILGSTGIAADERDYKYLTVPKVREAKGRGTAGTEEEEGLILVFDENNRKVKTKSLRARPVSAAIRGDRLYVTDVTNHRVLILDKNTLEEVGQFGEKGKEDTQFLYPRGLAVSADGRIYVGDTFNGRIKVFSPQGKLISQYGDYSPVLGGFIGLSGVAVDKKGIVYAVDSKFLMRPQREEVQILDSSLFYKKGEKVPPLDAKLEEKRNAIWGFFQKPYAMGDPENPQTTGTTLYAPVNVAIDYENGEYFRKYVPPGLKIEYLIWMTSQFARGGKNISVFAFLLKK